MRFSQFSGTYPDEVVPVSAVHTPPPEAAEVEPNGRGIYADPGLLLEPFRLRVENLCAALLDAGHEPRLWETFRTEARCELLKERGTSRSGTRSMHRHGVAADLICRRHMWDCGEHGCDYFLAQGRLARVVGLYWGGDWRSFKDRPHVQAIPVRLQNRVRRSNDVAELLMLPGVMRKVLSNDL